MVAAQLLALPLPSMAAIPRQTRPSWPDYLVAVLVVVVVVVGLGRQMGSRRLPLVAEEEEAHTRAWADLRI